MNVTAAWNSSVSSISPTRPNHDKGDSIVSEVYKSIFGGIAVSSFVGNLLLCVIICRKRLLLSKTYNLLLLNLAVTDMLTGE